MLTTKELHDLEERLLAVICPICIERDAEGKCGLWFLDQCPIRMHLPRLVHIVENVHSNLMEDYVNRVREDVCSTCPAPVSTRGKCASRQEKHCAMDAYLLPIVQIIDDFLAEKRVTKSAVS